MEKKGECFRLSSVRGKNVSKLANKPSKASEYFDLLKPQKILFLALALKIEYLICNRYNNLIYDIIPKSIRKRSLRGTTLFFVKGEKKLTRRLKVFRSVFLLRAFLFFKKKSLFSFSFAFTILNNIISNSKEGELEFIKKGKITG